LRLGWVMAGRVDRELQTAIIQGEHWIVHWPPSEFSTNQQV
jgi:hypothetical protein